MPTEAWKRLQAQRAIERAELRANARGWFRVQLWWTDNSHKVVVRLIAAGFIGECIYVTLRGIGII